MTIGSDVFNGVLDDIMIYSRALNVAEVDSLQNLTGPLVFPTSNIDVFSRSFDIYPNPISNIVNIQFDKSEIYQVEVMDITGRIIYSNQVSEQNVQINTAAWAAGLYAVTISNKNGILERKKIVKQ
jgi:hypothetical protein